MSADSVEEHSGEPEGGDVFNIDGAVETIGSDLFGKSEPGEPDTEPTAEPTVETEPTTEPEKVEPRKAPVSWKKEMHDSWGTLTPEIQDYIELREQQMKEGLDADRTDATIGRSVRDIITPYKEQFGEVDEKQVISNLLGAHVKLTTASPEEKQQLFSQLAQQYGVDLGKSEDYTNLQNEVYNIKNALSQREQAEYQQRRQQVEQEVESFASEHPLFEELEEDIASFINVGHTLEEAYEKALWANPVTRQKEIDRLNQQTEEDKLKKAKEDAEAKKKAKAVNVKSRDTNQAPTETKGTIEDTIAETLREIRSR